MSVWLAMDTATDFGSVAVGDAGSVEVEMSFGERRHAADLLPTIVEALRNADRDFADVSGVVVADGPGSFTGLRIGFATAKGLLRENPAAQLLAAPSMLCTAYSGFEAGHSRVATLYDALRGEVFAAVYRFDEGAVDTEISPVLCSFETLIERCPQAPSCVVGDGALLNADEVRRWTGADPVGPPDFVPKAGNLLHLLAMADAVRPVQDASAFEPEYGRLAEAQVRLERSRDK